MKECSVHFLYATHIQVFPLALIFNPPNTNYKKCHHDPFHGLQKKSWSPSTYQRCFNMGKQRLSQVSFFCFFSQSWPVSQGITYLYPSPYKYSPCTYICTQHCFNVQINVVCVSGFRHTPPIGVNNNFFKPPYKCKIFHSH